MADKNDPKVAKAAEKVVDAAADAITTAARTNDDAKAPKKATGPAKAYVNNEGPVYVDQVYTKAGEVFVTNAAKGANWEEVSPADAAAIDAATNRVPQSANLEAASKSALQAVAIMRHVNIAGLDKDELVTAIQGSYETRL